MIQIQYRTQRLSMRFFMLMLVLFVVQVAFGMLLAVQHIDPALLAGTLNFNIARAEHLNLGIIWILSGFIGTILFIGPLLSGRELAAPWMRSEEHTSELQSLMRISYAVFCLKK